MWRGFWNLVLHWWGFCFVGPRSVLLEGQTGAAGARDECAFSLNGISKGKTAFAKNLWPAPLVLRIGNSAHWPDAMRTFARGRHTHVVLDDVRDLAWAGRNQDKIQGVWDEELEFGIMQGGTCSYKKYLYRVPIVVTCNMSTANLEYLDSSEAHDFLGREENRVVLRLTERWS